MQIRIGNWLGAINELDPSRIRYEPIMINKKGFVCIPLSYADNLTNPTGLLRKSKRLRKLALKREKNKKHKKKKKQSILELRNPTHGVDNITKVN